MRNLIILLFFSTSIISGQSSTKFSVLTGIGLSKLTSEGREFRNSEVPKFISFYNKVNYRYGLGIELRSASKKWSTSGELAYILPFKFISNEPSNESTYNLSYLELSPGFRYHFLLGFDKSIFLLLNANLKLMTSNKLIGPGLENQLPRSDVFYNANYGIGLNISRLNIILRNDFNLNIQSLERDNLFKYFVLTLQYDLTQYEN